jgi:hypothetical protein
MKKIVAVIVLSLSFYGCLFIKSDKDEEKLKEYSQVEIIMSDFSKKITSYYERTKQPVPDNFNEQEFIRILEETYPDQGKVILIKENYIMKARSVNNGYSVVLCAPETNNKLMEDIADPRCSLSRVEIRFWDKEGVYPCRFEENWMQYCKQPH